MTRNALVLWLQLRRQGLAPHQLEGREISGIDAAVRRFSGFGSPSSISSPSSPTTTTADRPSFGSVGSLVDTPYGQNDSIIRATVTRVHKDTRVDMVYIDGRGARCIEPGILRKPRSGDAPGFTPTAGAIVEVCGSLPGSSDWMVRNCFNVNDFTCSIQMHNHAGDLTHG